MAYNTLLIPVVGIQLQLQLQPESLFAKQWVRTSTPCLSLRYTDSKSTSPCPVIGLDRRGYLIWSQCVAGVLTKHWWFFRWWLSSLANALLEVGMYDSIVSYCLHHVMTTIVRSFKSIIKALYLRLPFLPSFSLFPSHSPTTSSSCQLPLNLMQVNIP